MSKHFCKHGHDKRIVGTRPNGQCAECARDSVKKHRKTEDPVKRKLRYRSANLKKSFGLSIEDYTEILLNQNGVCAICGGNSTERHGEKLLHVDHNHSTGEIRELLCMSCNLGLGQFKDSPQLLRLAANYLEKHNAS